MKTGTPYEILTRDLFDQMVNQDRVENIKVEHDVILAGKTTSHQIDVYWKFKVGGVEYETVVQAKDWASAVDQGELLKFKEVLDDLPNQPRGVFVTRTGYQSGAEEFAKANGILLYELREPTEEDFEERLREIRLNITTYVPQATNVTVQQEAQWDDVRSEEQSMLIDVDTPIEKENGERVGTISEIIKSYYPTEMEDSPPEEILHSFDEPVYLRTRDEESPDLKLKALNFTVAVHEVNEQVILKADDVVGFILKNLSEETEITFDKEGDMRNSPSI